MMTSGDNNMSQPIEPAQAIKPGTTLETAILAHLSLYLPGAYGPDLSSIGLIFCASTGQVNRALDELTGRGLVTARHIHDYTEAQGDFLHFGLTGAGRREAARLVTGTCSHRCTAGRNCGGCGCPGCGYGAPVSAG